MGVGGGEDIVSVGSLGCARASRSWKKRTLVESFMCVKREMHRLTGVRIDIIAIFKRQAGL